MGSMKHIITANKYRTVAQKGEGTFSEVLKAQSMKNGKYVAIKVSNRRVVGHGGLCPTEGGGGPARAPAAAPVTQLTYTPPPDAPSRPFSTPRARFAVYEEHV